MNSASALKFLYAAYAATWLIHGAYIGILVRRFIKVRRELSERHQEGRVTR